MSSPRKKRRNPRFPEYLTGGSMLRDPVSRCDPSPLPHAATAPDNPDFSPYLNQLSRICERALGSAIESAEFPGGRYRESIVVTLKDGNTIVATRRDDPASAAIEHEALRRLAEVNAPTPRPLYWNGALLLQEFAPGPRLAQSIEAEPDKAGPLLADAMTSLALLHERGSAAGMDSFGPLLGTSSEWIMALIERPRVIGDFLGVKAPKLDADTLCEQFMCLCPRYVKWDARPGNAIALESGGVAWFDMEHTGAGCRLNDLIWLLGDETIPDDPRMEEALLDAAIPSFADGRSDDEARAFFYAFGAFHCSVRLGAMLDLKEDEPWGKLENFIARDGVVVTLEHALRLCRRGARWADAVPETRKLASWYGKMGDALMQLDKKSGQSKSQMIARRHA